MHETTESHSAFVTWLDDGDEILRSTELRSDAISYPVYPTGLAALEDGSVVVFDDANGIAFLARLSADASLGAAAFPNLGAGVLSAFWPTSVLELPTTGYVMVAHDGSVGGGSAVVLAGLDAQLRPMWSRRYKLAGDQALRALALPAAHLTDDDASATDLVAMKVFAKDGALDGGDVQASAVTLGASARTMASFPSAPRFTDVVTRPRSDTSITVQR